MTPVHPSAAWQAVMILSLIGGASAAQVPAASTAAIAGVVTDTAGRRLEHVSISLEGHATIAVTDDSGRFHMASLPAGVHDFTVRRIGFRLLAFEAAPHRTPRSSWRSGCIRCIHSKRSR